MSMDIHGRLVAGALVLIFSSIVTPFLAKNRKGAGWLNFVFCLVAGLLFAWIGGGVLIGGESAGMFTLNLGFGNVPLLVDGFSALFMVLISLMAVVAAFYSIGYMDHYSAYSPRSYYVNYPLFVLGMIGIVTVDDLTTGFSIAWQLMTVTSFFLIRFENRDKGIIRSANKYLILMELAWVLILAGALLIPGGAMGDTVAQLTGKLGQMEHLGRTMVFALLLLGFGLKAGVFPLGQLWLPDAHSVAPSPVSALLSGVMIKTGVYGIIRTLFWMIPASLLQDKGQNLGLVVACFGAVTLFIGTVQALKQHDAKRLHAYHSIGQMGYIILGIGSAHYFFFSDIPALKVLAALALIGALYHTINHAVFKGLLFLCTGSVQYATGMKDLNKLGGLMKYMPITAVVSAIAAASIAGVPAFSGFLSKWAVISSGLLAGKDAGLFVLFGIVALMTSAITLASYVKFFGMTFTAVGIEWNKTKDVHEVGGIMLLPKLVLAAICVIQGMLPFVFFGMIIEIFGRSEGSIVQGLFNDAAIRGSFTGSGTGMMVNLPGASLNGAVAMPVILVIIFFVAYAFVSWFKRTGGSTERTTKVWLCGYQDLNNLNRYKSSNLYAAFKNFMKWTGGNVHGS